MAAITSTAVSSTIPFACTEQTLSADDTITFNATKKQLLLLRNPTGGTLTATVDGAGGTNVQVAGIGPVDVTGGKAIAVPAGESRAVLLSAIKEFCKGVVHITGASGMKVALFDI